jgi:hypothetical protein
MRNVNLFDDIYVHVLFVRDIFKLRFRMHILYIIEVSLLSRINAEVFLSQLP